MKKIIKEILPYALIVGAVLLLNRFVVINAKIPSQ